jgi:hypothetical protein
MEDLGGHEYAGALADILGYLLQANWVICSRRTVIRPAMMSSPSGLRANAGRVSALSA